MDMFDHWATGGRGHGAAGVDVWEGHGTSIFLWFSHGFPMVFPWFSYGFPIDSPFPSRSFENLRSG